MAKPLTKDRKTDYWWVDSRRLVFEEGYNERENFGDIEALAASIRDGGIRTPLQCYKRGEEYVVRRGHRRTMALRILEKEAVPIIVPIFLVAKGYNPEMAVLDLIVENEALAFTPWEQAKVLRRLRNFGWKPKQMAERSGITLTYVHRLLSLADAPQRVIDLVREGRATATFAMDMIAEKRVEELLEMADQKKALSTVTDLEIFPAEPLPSKPERITRSDLRPNSWKFFRKWSREVKEEELPAAKAELFQWLKKMENGELTVDDFIKFFR